MKLQHIAVIFVLIMIPILMTLTEYINVHVNTIRAQTAYNKSLISATHDAALAFQVNTANNGYSTLQDSKMRDVEASISTFYNVLASSLRAQGYAVEDLQLYTPAILCTLYDGYYIYTKYKDEYYDVSSTPKIATKAESTTHYTYGLKPFISYSCRYVNGTNNDDFIVNYTLDNSITIIGKVGGNIVSKSGHLIELEDTTGYDFSNLSGSTGVDAYIQSKLGFNFTYNETLSENLVILKEDGTYEEIDPTNIANHAKLYTYVMYKSQKCYLEDTNNNEHADSTEKFFWYGSDYRKNYFAADMNAVLTDLYNNNNKNALKYYEEAVIFSKWVNDNLSAIDQSMAKDNGANPFTGTDYTNLASTSKIFNTSKTPSNNNNPLISGSAFNEHRLNVIRYSITKNISNVINNFGSGMGSEFLMPKISESEWYNIENNVTFVAFLQGLPMKSKVYNNYCVVSNNTNKETVNTDSIYLIATIDGKTEYHKPGCKYLSEKYTDLCIDGAYIAGDFKRRSISTTGEDVSASVQNNGDGVEGMGKAFFYPQSCTACYECIVNAADVNSPDDIINKKGKYASGQTAARISQYLYESSSKRKI